MRGYRKGCNVFQANKIRSMLLEGVSIEDISNKLKIQLDTVKSYADYYFPPRRKARKKPDTPDKPVTKV